MWVVIVYNIVMWIVIVVLYRMLMVIVVLYSDGGVNSSNVSFTKTLSSQ